MSLLVTRSRGRLKARGRSKGLPTVLMGYAIECLVEAYALIGSGGRLTTARPGSDVDHKDFIVDEKGGYRSIYVQVKGAPRLYQGGEFQINVRYAKNKVLSGRRLVYVFCLLDADAMSLTRMWVIPARDFHRLAPRVSVSERHIQFLFHAGRNGKWTRFEIIPTQLGVRLLEIIRGLPRQTSARRT